jgi:hypothetical protein
MKAPYFHPAFPASEGRGDCRREARSGRKRIYPAAAFTDDAGSENRCRKKMRSETTGFFFFLRKKMRSRSVNPCAFSLKLREANKKQVVVMGLIERPNICIGFV